MNTITDAAVLRAPDPKRFPKNSGMVDESSCCVRSLVLLPRITQAKSDPMKAFPSPTQVEATPNFHPN